MRRARTLLLLASLLLPGCSYALISNGAIVESYYRSLVFRTTHARGLPFPETLEAQVISREEIPAFLGGVFEEEWAPEDLSDYQEGLIAIGLWPADRGFSGEVVAVSAEEFAGMYEPRERVLYVVSDISIPFSIRFQSALQGRDLYREGVLAHEIVHALQHETYPELVEHGGWREQDDAALAVRAALEGDATFYAFRAMAPDANIPPDLLRDVFERELASREGTAFANAPALIRLTLTFPYTEGYALSYAEHAKLLDEPPASTEQVLHPEMRRASFEAIDLHPLRRVLPDGCRFLAENTVGELGLSVLFRDLGESVPPLVWEGWDGDRFVAARCEGRRAFLWVTAWDAEDDARQFADAYAGVAQAVSARAGLSTSPRITLRGRDVVVASDALASAAATLARHARRGRVATLAELRDHFGTPP